VHALAGQNGAGKSTLVRILGGVERPDEGRILAQGPTGDVLTAPMIQQLYGVDADVRFHEGAGHITVTPMRRAQ